MTTMMECVYCGKVYDYDVSLLANCCIDCWENSDDNMVPLSDLEESHVAILFECSWCGAHLPIADKGGSETIGKVEGQKVYKCSQCGYNNTEGDLRR